MPDLTLLRAFWWGVLHAIGMFELSDLTNEEKIVTPDLQAWFCCGEVVMATILAGCIAVPGRALVCRADSTAARLHRCSFLFLPLFVFLPRLIRYAMEVDTDAVLDAFGKNEQVRKVFWTLFITTAGLVLVQVVDPATAEKIVGMLTEIIP